MRPLRPSLRRAPLAALTLTLLASAAGAQDFEPGLARAKERAAEEQKPLVCLLLAEGEGRSVALLEALDARALEPWRAATLTVAGELATGQGGRRRKPPGGLSPEDLRRIAPELRAELLLENDQGVVAVPQIAWLAPDGAVLLSVPYELDEHELEWCFAAAFGRAGATPPAAASADARPPRRLLLGELYRPPAADLSGRGLTPDELEAEIGRRRGQPFGGDAVQSWIRILFTFDDDAAKFAEVELSRGLMGWMRGQRSLQTIDYVGAASPRAFWPVLGDLARADSADVRRHVAAALEQLGAADALKTVRGALDKEQQPAARADWLRALAACGRTDRGARKKLLSTVASKREEPLVRRAALVALGHLQPDADVREALTQHLAGDDPELRRAAAAAVGLSRDGALRAELAAARERAQEPAEQAALDAALAVLDGENLARLEGPIEELLGEGPPRPRLFFRSGAALGAPPGRGGGGR